MSNPFQKDAVTLANLTGQDGSQKNLAVLDIEDGEMVAGVECSVNGTFPQRQTGNEVKAEGVFCRLDQNGDPYRWHNFLIINGENYDELVDEYGLETEIPWDVLWDAGIVVSEFERNLHYEIPQGATAKVMVQRAGDQLNVVSHELAVKDASQADRFAQNNSGAINRSAVENGQTEEETVNA